MAQANVAIEHRNETEAELKAELDAIKAKYKAAKEKRVKTEKLFAKAVKVLVATGKTNAQAREMLGLPVEVPEVSKAA